MDDSNFDLKRPFIDLIRKQMKKLEGLSIHYKETEQLIPSDEKWKLSEKSPFDEWADPSARKQKEIIPSDITEIAIHALDEYIRAIENFSIGQLEAFFMGLGLKWIPFQYWGLTYLRECHKHHKQAVDYFERVESKVKEGDLWQHKDKDMVKALDRIKPEYLLRSKIISRDLALINSILCVLSKKAY